MMLFLKVPTTKTLNERGHLLCEPFLIFRLFGLLFLFLQQSFMRANFKLVHVQ